MNYFAPGLRELSRIFERLFHHAHFLVQRRKLGDLESHLGLLGWQQADYDPGTQHHVDRLTDYERTQVQFTNQSAELGNANQQLEERRVTERAAFETQRAELVAARAPWVASTEEGEKELAALRDQIAQAEKKAVDLDQEFIKSEQQYQALLAKGEHTEEEQKQVAHLQRRTIYIPREKRELQLKLEQLRPTLPPLEVEVEQRRARLAVETEALTALEKTFAENDEALVQEIVIKKREKQKLERQINELEKAKAHPYREIGRALADQRIEPLNQPHALADVLRQREVVATHETAIAVSLAKSSLENRSLIWTSWLLLFTALVLIIVAISVILYIL